MQLFHIIVYTPVTHANSVRRSLAQAGAGQIGNYDSCSFSCRGTGRFRPHEEADPHIGKAGTVEEVFEERIEAAVTEEKLKAVIAAVTEAHPYEEPAIHVLPMLDYHTLSSERL